MTLSEQVAALILPALQIACITWIAAYGNFFKSSREFFVQQSESSKTVFFCGFFHLFTSKYWLSSFTTLFFLLSAKYYLWFADWRGYLLAGFALIGLANVCLILFAWVRSDIKMKKMNADMDETKFMKVINKSEIPDFYKQF